MNIESQLQVAFSTIAELKDQLASLHEVNWSLQERLRVIDERHEKELEELRRERDEARSEGRDEACAGKR